MSDSRFHRLTVAEVIAESDDACSFVFDVPAALRDAFTYRPGQFLTLNVPCADATVARCYSLSSAPGIDAAPKITVKRVRDGRASNWLCDRVKAGDALDVLPPAGVFTPRTLDGDLLLFAGGSGITPVLSILKSALVHGRGMLTLIYANRDERSVIFRAELQQLAQRHPGRVRVIHWLDSVQGIPQQRHLEELARPFSQQETFICGPALFMENALAAMLGLGLPRSRVHVERFASLPDTPAQAPDAAAPGAAAAPASGDGAAIETVLDGDAFAFDSAPGETLLDAMLRAGVPAPNSCRMGQCGACMCRIERGEVALDSNHVLDEDEIAAGWTLACCARPASDALRVVFPD
ncbi:ferredoxin--NADP reductase [Burkholderia lata]|uniref:3-ketosteroid-9-alpha-hydroxylase reductase subunit n=1 Tax=Burkholderia lata (strain ATCC 17760 / DSM 23089 / LMG 22485 / NCIMB 9086 / R18194 / 383) TaxID=482957 RepID=A0A6P3CDV4_BURL3|nr:ferredoxin--NADP reductase [Burkholderia lata]VWC04822.1 3-ketosteroid-9-alpha-hydroxylase reductase subunit [Burkholderia lata]VWM13776.1 3-ketosteroid-9-alpha-hydroxylase reductase subunit [Burkholderia lata]